MKQSVTCPECQHSTFFEEDIPPTEEVTGSLWCDNCDARIRWMSNEGSTRATAKQLSHV